MFQHASTRGPYLYRTYPLCCSLPGLDWKRAAGMRMKVPRWHLTGSYDLTKTPELPFLLVIGLSSPVAQPVFRIGRVE